MMTKKHKLGHKANE